jgi:hypothetical protein
MGFRLRDQQVDERHTYDASADDEVIGLDGARNG